MFKNLKGEMVKKDLTNKQLAEKLKISERAIRNKLNGVSEFTWSEVLTIKECFFPEISLEILFSRKSA